MRFSSKKLAEMISITAHRLYFIIIITQVPLFRFPCRKGSCETPLDVMTCQLVVSEVFPEFVVKALLYPAAIKRSLLEGTVPFPNPNQILDSYKSRITKTSGITDLRHLEVIAGSYLCVAGAFLGRGRMSVFGLLLILWGIIKEVFSGKRGDQSLRIYSEMIITIVIACCSVRKDVRKLIKCCKPDCIVKCLKNYSKSKHN